MATTLTTKVNLNINTVHTSDAEGLATAQSSIEQQLLLAMADGVGLDQADLVYSEKDQSISGAVDKDLSGVLLDAFGAALTFVKVKALMITAAVANTDTIIAFGKGAGGFLGPLTVNTETLIIRPGGAIVIFAPDVTGYPVVNASTDILTFDVGGGTQVFSWQVVGTSA